jgi:hypothetical protein
VARATRVARHKQITASIDAVLPSHLQAPTWIELLWITGAPPGSIKCHPAGGTEWAVKTGRSSARKLFSPGLTWDAPG